MVGYAMCGSFCTLKRAIDEMEGLVKGGVEIQPIMSERAYSTSTRFGTAESFVKRVEEITGRDIIHTVRDAEPLGPTVPLDALIIAPCTGNTLSKLSLGITDSAVTMAAKAHLRQDRPLLIALSSNDALSQNLSSIARLITRRGVYFLPMRQDDIKGKPHSLVAELSLITEGYRKMLRGEQLRPVFLE
jgi:dipicolinate synthase subunit B